MVATVKLKRKPKWQLRMDNPETSETFGTQYTGRRKKAQQRKLKR
jgi:hypothetical protein